MTIKHNFQTGKTTIDLNWNETRQFIDSSVARENVRTLVADLVQGPAPKTDNHVVSKTV